jgi:hypothetical protein
MGEQQGAKRYLEGNKIVKHEGMVKHHTTTMHKRGTMKQQE